MHYLWRYLSRFLVFSTWSLTATESFTNPYTEAACYEGKTDSSAFMRISSKGGAISKANLEARSGYNLIISTFLIHLRIIIFCALTLDALSLYIRPSGRFIVNVVTQPLQFCFCWRHSTWLIQIFLCHEFISFSGIRVTEYHLEGKCFVCLHKRAFSCFALFSYSSAVKSGQLTNRPVTSVKQFEDFITK